MEKLLEQVEKDINKYGNVRPATLKKLDKFIKNNQKLEGKGIVSNVHHYDYRQVKRNVKKYIHTALTSRPGVIDRLIKQYGDKKILQVTILRKPVERGIQKLLNLITMGGFNKAKKEMNYDEVYHLFVNMHLENGQIVGVEKNQRVNVNLSGFPTSGLDPSNILKINCNVLLKEMFEKAERSSFADRRASEQSGESFYRYNAVTANCQRFISVLMQAGGITGTDIFVMQDATQLIKNSGLRRVAGVITDAAALGERAVKGHGRTKCTCNCKPKPRKRKKTIN